MRRGGRCRFAPLWAALPAGDGRVRVRSALCAFWSVLISVASSSGRVLSDASSVGMYDMPVSERERGTSRSWSKPTGCRSGRVTGHKQCVGSLVRGWSHSPVPRRLSGRQRRELTLPASHLSAHRDHGPVARRPTPRASPAREPGGLGVRSWSELGVEFFDLLGLGVCLRDPVDHCRMREHGVAVAHAIGV